MTKMSKKQLEQRKVGMTSRARAAVAKTETMQFRLDAENIQLLYEMAVSQRKPVGAMVREWVLERLQFESLHVGKKSSPHPSISPKRVMEMQAELLELAKRVTMLEKSKRKV